MTDKPICLVNIEGFYDGFIAQLRRAEEDGILYESAERCLHWEDDPEAALRWSLAEVARIRDAKDESARLLVPSESIRIDRLTSRFTESFVAGDSKMPATASSIPTSPPSGALQWRSPSHLVVLVVGVVAGYAVAALSRGK